MLRYEWERAGELIHIAVDDGTVSKAFAKPARHIQTLCSAWAYAMSFQNSEERTRRLPRSLALTSAAAR